MNTKSSRNNRVVTFILFALVAMMFIPQIQAADSGTALSLTAAATEMKNEAPVHYFNRIASLVCYGLLIAAFILGVIATIDWINSGEFKRAQGKYLGLVVLLAFSGVFGWMGQQSEQKMTSQTGSAFSAGK